MTLLATSPRLRIDESFLEEPFWCDSRGNPIVCDGVLREYFWLPFRRPIWIELHDRQEDGDESVFLMLRGSQAIGPYTGGPQGDCWGYIGIEGKYVSFTNEAQDMLRNLLGDCTECRVFVRVLMQDE
jgi:hypothetical protein